MQFSLKLISIPFRPQALDYTWTFQATATTVTAVNEEGNNSPGAENTDGNFAELQPLRIDAASATTLDDLDQLTDLIQVKLTCLYCESFIQFQTITYTG